MCKQQIKNSLLLLSVILLNACSSMYIYDENKDKQINTAASLYRSIESDKSLIISPDNLEQLLQAELALSDESDQLILNNDLWRMSSGQLSLSRMYHEAQQRLSVLGLNSLAEVRDYIRVRTSLIHFQGIEQEYRDYLIQLTTPEERRFIPHCNDSTPTFVKQMQSNEAFQLLYQQYHDNCQQLLSVLRSYDEMSLEVGLNRTQSTQLQRELLLDKELKNKALIDINMLKKRLKNTAVVKKRSSEFNSLRNGDLKKAFSNTKTQSNSARVILTTNTIEAISNLIQGINTNDDISTKANYLVDAAIASQSTALADIMANFLVKNSQPVLAPLVLELNRQILLLNYFQELEDLKQQEYELLQVLENDMHRQVSAEYKLMMAICDFSYQSKSQCENDFSLTWNSQSSSYDCGFKNVYKECQTNKQFKSIWLKRARDNKPQVYKILTALYDSHQLRSKITRSDIHLKEHKSYRHLLASQSAIDQWHNLLRYPIDQLQTFYDSGIRTEELSGLIIKALGIVGLTVVGTEL